MIDALSDFHQDKSVRGVILTASGTTFCSGVNLKEWQSLSVERDAIELWQQVASELQELIEAMLRLPKPIIAAIDGPVLGFGMTKTNRGSVKNSRGSRRSGHHRY